MKKKESAATTLPPTSVTHPALIRQRGWPWPGLQRPAQFVQPRKLLEIDQRTILAITGWSLRRSNKADDGDLLLNIGKGRAVYHCVQFHLARLAADEAAVRLSQSPTNTRAAKPAAHMISGQSRIKISHCRPAAEVPALDVIRPSRLKTAKTSHGSYGNGLSGRLESEPR